MSDLRARGGLARSTALHLALMLFLGLIAYSNTFNSPFQFDDAPNIPENPFIKDISSFIGTFTGKHAMVDISLKSRAVGYFTFALNWQIHDSDVTGYHAVNLTIHIMNAFLVYWLVLLTFRMPRMKDSRLREISGFVGLTAALLFVSHPLQTQAVTYVVQRLASLATLFYLLSLALYIKCRLEDTINPKSLSIYILALLSAVLAMKTKEIAFTLPPTVALCEFIFAKGAIKKRLLYLAPFFLTFLIIPVTMLGAAGNITDSTRLATEMSRIDYLFTQFRIIVTYMRLLTFPINQTLVYDYSTFSSLYNPQVLPSFLLLLLVFGLGLCLLRRPKTSEPALKFIAFGIFWFFITLSVESSIIPIVDVIFEHRVYLPSAGAFIAVAAAAAIALDRLKSRKSRIAASTIIMIIPLCLTAATYSRNTVWQSDAALWEDVVRKAPGSVRGQYNLGIAYADRGRLEEAREHYRAALSIKPDYVEAHNNLAIVFRKMGLPDQAIVHYRASINLRPDDAKPHYNLGNVYREMGLLDDAEVQYRKAIELSSNIDEAYVNLGLIYKKRGMLEDAISYYMNALRLNPDNTPARRNLGNAYLEQGKPDMAISEYLEALRLRPEDYDAHYTLALAYQKMGLDEKAQEHFRLSEDLKRKAESANK